jgi:nitroreductase/NAD-dependent dihydropyrimidine dehydrogenase PreA subunit
MDMPEPVSRPYIRIDGERCRDCSACKRVCPSVRFKGYAAITDIGPDGCLRCGHCLAVCPNGAIIHEGFDAAAFTPLAPPPSPESVLEIVRLRHSIRQYAKRPVERAQWNALLAAMAYAPSGMNARPMRAIVVSDPEKLTALSHLAIEFYAGLLQMLKSPSKRLLLRLTVGRKDYADLRRGERELAEICARAKEGIDPILHGAPGALILHAKRDAACGRDDCLLAAMTAMLFAPSLGLGTCLIGFLLPPLQRMPAMRVLINLPADDDAYAVLAVGHPSVSYHHAPPRPGIPVTWQ